MSLQLTGSIRPVLLAVMLGGSLLSFAQNQTAGSTPAEKPAAGSPNVAPNASAFSTAKEKLSYTLGVDVGKHLKAAAVDIDPAILGRGIADTLNGAKMAMSDEELRATMMEFQTHVRQKQMEMVKELADKNKKDGEAFLAENKSKEGVVTLPSGLQYKILKTGDGPKPTAAETVVCNYRGTLINGKEFDSSYSRGQPASFPVGGVIKGWTEALQLMPVGSKWQLFIPSDLAYGERGAGPDIGPNSTLIFEVELLSIAKDAEKK